MSDNLASDLAGEVARLAAALAAERAVSDKLLEACENLVIVRGRFHAEQAYKQIEKVLAEVEALRKGEKR